MLSTKRFSRTVRLRLERLEARDVPSTTPIWSSYAHDPQHTDISTVASQPLETVRWSTPVDLAPNIQNGDILIHYGSPLVTANNTVLVPVKTSSGGAYRIEAHNGGTGQLLWELTTDYTTPQSSWTPSFSPVLTPQGRLYFQGPGGTVYYADNLDSNSAPTVHQLAFFGLDVYTADETTYNTEVQISTPITSDSAGDIFFGFVVSGNTSANLKSGLARIDADGQGTWSAATVMANDTSVVSVDFNCSPALSNDGNTLYVAVNKGSNTAGYLLALNSTTLAQTGRVLLLDPKSGFAAELLNISTASPVVGPDGDVYFGVIESPFPENNDRGWLLHFNADLTQEKTPGAFGWDDTPSIVPASMVPSYHGASTYLLMAKYNNYAGIGTGNGQNRVAILDPNDQTQIDPVTGVRVMNPVLSILGPTPDSENPGGVREWCINAAAVDPATGSVLVNSEDGTLYRWDLSTNTFTQKISLAPPTGEAYTPTVIGGDGTVYAINDAMLWAVGAIPQLSAANIQVNQSTTTNVDATFTLTLAQPDSQQVTVNYATADGTALAGQDYTQTSGMVSFAPGETSQTVTVPVLPTNAYAPSKSFSLKLSGVTNAKLLTSSAVATIINPLPAPTISIGDLSAVDGQSGVSTPFTFQVTLSEPSSQTIKVDFATANGSAVAPADYASTQGTLTFAPGQMSQQIVVQVTTNPQSHPVKTFTITLSNSINASIQKNQATGTILNDVGSLSISDFSGTVNSVSAVNFVFKVSLADPVSLPVTVQVATADGTAQAGKDYQALSLTTLTFNPGQTTMQVTVVVNANPNPGSTTNFTVNLSNPTNAYLADGQGVGTITNQNTVSILGFSAGQFNAKETDNGAAISIVRSGDLTRTITVKFVAGGGSSSPATEYQAVTQTVTFNPGDTVKNVVVPLIDDHHIDPLETVNLSLSDVSTGGILGSISSATLAIKDEDGTPNERYVFALYEDLLQRAPDQGGLAYWSGLLGRGMPRGQLVSTLEGSAEYQSVVINGYYIAYLGRAASTAEIASGLKVFGSAQSSGLPTPQDQIRAQILGSNEYFQNRGNGTNSGFLTAIYHDLLGRAVDSVGSMVFGTALSSGTSRTQIALTIVTSRETEQALVKSYYALFLQRPGDSGGVSFFTSQLLQGVREEAVVAALTASNEFFQLSQE